MRQISENKTPSGNFTLPTEDDGITIEDDAQSTDIQIEDMDDTGSETISISNDQEGDIQIEDIEDDSETQDIQIEDPDAEKDNMQDRTDMLDQNFESQELIVKTDNIREIDEDRIISQCDDVYLLKFPNKTSAERAYSVYYEQDNDFVAPNINLSIQTDDTDIELADSYEKPEATGSALEILETELKDIEPIKAKNNMIAVIDTGVRSSNDQIIEKVSMLGDDGSDDNGHGTEMIQTISDADPNAKIISIKALDSSGYGDVTSIYSAIKYAIEKKVDIINLSIAGYSIAENQAITAIINEAINADIAVVGAAGNYSSDVKNFIPGNIDDVYVMGACLADGTRIKTSNYGSTVDFNIVSSSTSQATARFTGEFSKANCQIKEIKRKLNQTWVFSPRYKNSDIKIENTDDIKIENPNNTDNTDTKSGFQTQAVTLHDNGLYKIKDFDFVMDRLCMNPKDNDVTITGSNKWQVGNIDGADGIAVYWNENLSGNDGSKQHKSRDDCYLATNDGSTYNLSDLTLRFPYAVDGADGESYDLEMELTNIKVFVKAGTTANHPAVLGYVMNKLEFYAYTQKNQHGVQGTSLDCNFGVYKHGTDDMPEGKLLLSFIDLDQDNCHDEYRSDTRRGCYQECITINDSYVSDAYVESGANLYISDNHKRYFGKQNTDDSENAGVTFKGDANGLELGWEGFSCSTFIVNTKYPTYNITARKEGPGTLTKAGEGPIKVYAGSTRIYKAIAEDHAHIESIEVDDEAINIPDNKKRTYTFNDVRDHHHIKAIFDWDKYKQITKIRHQKIDGTWEDYTEVDNKMIIYNHAYHYTWSRDATTEPANVYDEPDPKKVGIDHVIEDGTYTISIPRFQYTYSFDLNVPGGHTTDEITNKQTDFTKYAENMSGDILTPALTGFTFKEWNTNADGSGSTYANEKMLSDKTFYAVWEPMKYYIRYNGNGTSEPNKLPGEFTQNIVTTASGMPNTEFEYDKIGSLQPNDFVRSGYEFIGWNTNPDGTGIAFPNSPYNLTNMYSDQYNAIYNITTTPNAILDLYAQWRKKLGTETITVISEETGNPVPNTYFRLYKQVYGNWESVPGMEVQRTNANGQITLTNLHWFNYEWRATEVPTGYQTPPNTGFYITHDHLSENNTVILYMIRTSITLKSEVSDIIRGENPPAFMYHISGYDVAGVPHEYNILVNTSIATNSGEKTLVNIFAGRYDITQKPISRYNPQNTRNVIHGSINGINAHVTPLTLNGSSVTFPYTIKQYGGFGSMDNIDNKINK